MPTWLTILLYWLLADVCIVMMLWGSGNNRAITEDEYKEYIAELSKSNLMNGVR